MYMRRTLLLVLLLLSIYHNSLQAQFVHDYPEVESQLISRGEIFFQFQLSSSEQLKLLTKLVSLDDVQATQQGDLTVKAYANRDEFEAFLEMGIPFELLAAPGINQAAITSDWRLHKSTQAWDTYPTYPAYLSMMQDFETNYPDLCELHNIGTSTNGRSLLYLKITNSLNDTFPKPRFNYTSSMHGDETTGYVLMLRLIDLLLTQYGTNPEITQLVDNMEIWINPLANPDGTYYGGDNSVASAIRYNAQNIDINRNFPDYLYGQHPDNLQWTPETMAFMAFADSLHFVMGANFHGGAEVINYPWDVKASLHPDDNWLMFVSREYADTVHAHSSGTNYLTYLNDGITNGYAWYQVTGGRQDYMNYYNRCREITMEISNTKNPAASTLPDFWDYNYRSLINYMKQAGYGVRGIVTDSITGAPLEANIFINGHDEDHTDVNTELPWGVYYRLLKAGSWDLSFSSPGYQTKTITVQVSDYASLTLDVQLSLALPTVLFSPSALTSCTGLISFNNESLTSTGSTLSWNFGDGSTSDSWSPEHQYTGSGSFEVSLSITNAVGTTTYIYPSLITISMPAIPTISSEAICTGNPAAIYADYDDTYWYADSEGNSLISQGDTLWSDTLYADTSFYYQRIIQSPSTFTGKPDNTGTGNYFTNSQIHYLVFDCYEACVLKTVVVYSNGTGSRTITLRDEAGNILQSATVSVVSGMQTIALDFNLPVASNLRLAGPSNPNFYRNNDASTVTYPYEIANIISIKSSSATTSPYTYYYFFYAWEIEPASCQTPILPIHIDVFDSSPSVDFTYQVSNDTVWFTNLSSNYASFTWDFGDGSYESAIESPFHVYAAAGTYQINLQGINPCGIESKNVNVQISIGQDQIDEEARFSLFPNPAENEIHILIPEQYRSLDAVFTLYDSFGRKISAIQYENSTYTESIQIDINALQPGIYMIQFTNKLYMGSETFIRLR